MRENRIKITVKSGLTRREAAGIRNETNKRLIQGKKVVGALSTVDQLIDKINELLRPQMSNEYCDLIIRSMVELEKHTGPRLSAIDIEGIDSMIADILDRGCTDATANKYLRHCSAGCQKAVEWDMLSENPFDNVSMRVEPDKDIRIVTEDEERLLLDACKNTRDRCIIYLGIDGGLRAKEIANFNIWEDFDEVKGWVRIVNRDGVTTKTKKQRVIYIFNDDRKQELVALKHSRSGYGHFPFYNGNAHCVSQRVIQIRKRAGLDCSLHDLRRTCATRQLLNGVPVPIVAKWLGHSIEVMQKFYVSIRVEDLMQVRDRLRGVQYIEHPDSDCFEKVPLK